MDRVRELKGCYASLLPLSPQTRSGRVWVILGPEHRSTVSTKTASCFYGPSCGRLCTRKHQRLVVERAGQELVDEEISGLAAASGQPGTRSTNRRTTAETVSSDEHKTINDKQAIVSNKNNVSP
jgi:hypothetical protein